MTAAEAAAQIAAQAAAVQYGAPGVFSLDQLAAMGKTGTMAQQWTAQGTPAPGALIGGGGNAALTATGLQAGYYQVPGQQGAEYYDPHSGQASAEFVAWANGATQDQLASAFIPTSGGPAATVAAAQMPADAAANFAAEAALINSGMSNQDAQNKVLGTQQFVAGANGQQETMAQALGPQAGGGYRDVSTSSSKYVFMSPDGVKTFQGYWADPSAPGAAVPYSDVAADTQASEDALAQHNQDAYAALQQERVIAAAEATGVDPGNALRYGTGLPDIQNIADTGISAAQTAEISRMYASIQTPDEQAAYIAMQDPGNLTPSLRAARDAARGGQTNWMTANALAPTVEWQGTQAYGGSSDTKGQIKVTRGDVTQTDATTGRSVMFGNVVTKIEYVAPESIGAFGNAMHRLGGALYGGIMGYIGSFGNPIGAAIGAAQGSGALGGINMKNPGKTTWGAAQTPGSIQSVLLSMGEAIAFAHFGVGNMGVGARVAVGAGMGTVNGFISGGTRGGEVGGVAGAAGGYFSGGQGPSWASKAQNAYQGF